jgi:hypothetical protein
MASLDRTSYDDTRIEWDKLRRFAARVARETKVARQARTQTRQVSNTREVKSGFLGLSKRVETYTVPQVETVTDDYWVLEQRYWQMNEKGAGSYADETSYNDICYCLGVDGSLFVRVESHQEVYPKGRACFEVRDEPTTSLMKEADVMLFDFEAENFHSEGQISVDTNRTPDEGRLKYHAKGVGLSMALKRLLEGAS